MTTIVLNTLNGAVTEYTGFGFQAITPTHAGSATGLFSLGGNTDAGVPIVARIQTGQVQWGTSLKKFTDDVYFAIKSTGTLRLHVAGQGGAWTYDYAVRASGQSRAVPGRGIKENYLSFGLSNPSGQAFQLNKIEVGLPASESRRV